MLILRKLKLTIQLHYFLKQYSDTLIVGGPKALAWLGRKRQSFGHSFYSQCGQDSFILSWFFGRITAPDFPAVFVDVGCNHPVKHNNSYFFERFMGFKVLAIDALPTHQPAWQEKRPRSEMVITAVGQAEGVLDFEEVECDGREGDMFSSVSGVSRKAITLSRNMRKVPVMTLTTLLQNRNLNNVGIMSIDVEGYEMQALLGLDLKKIKVHIIILENNSDDVLGSDKIRTHLIINGYSYFARIWGMDDIFVLQKS